VRSSPATNSFYISTAEKEHRAVRIAGRLSQAPAPGCRTSAEPSGAPAGPRPPIAKIASPTSTHACSLRADRISGSRSHAPFRPDPGRNRSAELSGRFMFTPPTTTRHPFTMTVPCSPRASWRSGIGSQALRSETKRSALLVVYVDITPPHT